MQIAIISERPFQRLPLDIVEPLPLKKVINTLLPCKILTKYTHAKPIPNHESETIANRLIEFTSIFGIPEALLTDQGTEFNSNLIKELSKLFKIRHMFSSLYHSQTNGALERSHATLKKYLKHFIKENQTDWDLYTSLAMFTYSTHKHFSTQYTHLNYFSVTRQTYLTHSHYQQSFDIRTMIT